MIYFWTLKFAVVVIFVIGDTPFLQAQTSDFFSNTQSNGKLAVSASGCPTGATCSANAPGFNPANLVRHADPGATISGFPGVEPTGPVLSTFFSQLGPGAITDNMFGVIENPASPTTCGAEVGVGTNDVGTNKLNCGNLRFEPGTQGQTLPTFPASNNLTSASGDVTFINDFNASGDDHIGFNLTNNLVLPSPTTTSNIQQMRQVVALTAGANTVGCTPATPPSSTRPAGCPGTETSPGTGDQLLEIDTSWSAGSLPFTGTTITWSMVLDDVDPLTPAGLTTNQTDSINTMGLLATDGSFIYNGSGFPSILIPAPCWWSGCTTPTDTISIP